MRCPSLRLRNGTRVRRVPGPHARSDRQCAQARPSFRFDSFQGLPEDWCSNIPAGTFATGQLPDVPGAKLVVGWFNDTLACIWMQTSTRRQPPSPEHVGPRLRPGSVIVFDEYLNYRG